MKIVVLAGGISTERDVSLSSGKKIYGALKKMKQQVILIDVFMGYEGEVETVFKHEKDWAEYIGEIKEKEPNISELIKERANAQDGFFGPNVIKLCKQADIVFLALHGEDGENGKIQATFDLLGIKYTGTDYVSAALAMDKSLTKELFKSNNIQTPKGMVVKQTHADVAGISFPKVVKVASGGSSVGVYITNNQEEYEEALTKCFELDNQIIVEEFIEGREFSIGIIDGDALPIIEIIPHHGFYDYKNKYQVGGATELCPAELSIEKEREMKRIAEKVFRVLRLKTYARIDFLMRKSDEEIFCLEANTLPGMTPTSLLPQEAAVAGITYPELCMKIVEISLKERM